MTSESPLLQSKHFAHPAVFQPENLLWKTRRQNSLHCGSVPTVGVLDPDAGFAHACVCQQETKRRKIAIPLSTGRLAEHFGHCEQFALLDVEATSKQILQQTRVVPPPHEPGVLPRRLHEQGAQVIIAGGMGRRAVDLFAQNGIAVHAGVAGRTPEETVQAFLDGALGNAAPTGGHGRGDGSHHECHHRHTH